MNEVALEGCRLELGIVTILANLAAERDAPGVLVLAELCRLFAAGFGVSKTLCAIA